jgi:putative heme-binding domain-containing protein
LVTNSVAPARPDRRDTAAWIALVSTGGDPAAGARVFYDGRRAACYRCHQIEGRGGTIGPELSVTPRSLSVGRVLESLLEPSKEMAPQFVPWNVVRKDGTVFSGVLLAEHADGTRRYGTADGQVIVVQPSEIAEVRPQAVSIMPDNICDQMTITELRDLLAYLQSAH